jgi:molybdenum cofactor synthesis domain-containing protein
VTTAAIIVIGNEVLSGKVDEQNARFLIKELRALGVELRRVSMIRDDVDTIADEVRALAPQFDHVFTTGGVGSTHDDVTLEGVAKGLGVPIERSAELESLIHAHFRERVTDSVLRMADLPRGATLLGADLLVVPVVRVRNLFVLPGVPEFVRSKFEVLRPLLRDRPIALRQIDLSVGEDRIAELLREALAAVPGIEIGSYPRFDEADYKVRVTVESKESAAVDRGIDFLLARLDPSVVVRVH